MTYSLRNLAVAASVAGLALFASPAMAASVGAATPATAKAVIVKPLTLQKQFDMDFGSIVVQDSGTITLDNTGAITCSAALTCATTGTPAEYKVTGTNNQAVQISKPDVTMTNTDLTQGGTPLTLVLNGFGPTSVTLPNSGSTGINFKLGGQIAIPANVKDGTYSGNLNVTVNY